MMNAATPLTRSPLALLLALPLMLPACGSDSDPGGEKREKRLVCPSGESYIDGACAPDADGDGIADAKDEEPSTEKGAPTDAQGRSLKNRPAAWSSGPYGSKLFETAGDFTLQTTEGPWRFSEKFTGDDHYVFFFYESRLPATTKVWASDPKKLLEESPKNVHYFFFSYSNSPANEIATLKARFETAYTSFADGTYWKERIHFVETPSGELDPTLRGYLDLYKNSGSYAPVAFAIDWQQRWRLTGDLSRLLRGDDTDPAELRYLSTSVIGFNYDRTVAEELAAANRTHVTIAKDYLHAGRDGANGELVKYLKLSEGQTESKLDVTLPSAKDLSQYDSMAIYTRTDCPNHLDMSNNGCPAWDMIAHLLVCPEGTDSETCCPAGVYDESCNAEELLRYVTPYHREGAWLTDVTPLLPLIKSGGKRTFIYVGINGYVVNIEFLLWNAHKDFYPYEAIRMPWGAAQTEQVWDATYYEATSDMGSFKLSAAPDHAELITYITGHGFGSTTENCAEFCNHQHEFDVNGELFLLDHPLVNEGEEGCYKQAYRGVTPNQYGTEHLGRAGWCPGESIAPRRTDLTNALSKGENELYYQALFKGKMYNPKYLAVQDPYLPHLRLTAWIVLFDAQ